MPAEGCVPIPPEKTVVLVTAKPGRQAWALEEVLDTVFPVDPGAEVLETGFEGFIIVESSARRRRLARAIRSTTYAFISFITLAAVECWPRSPGEVLDWVYRLAMSASGRPLRLRVKTRGEGKKLLGRSDVEEAARSAGARLSRAASVMLVVESAGLRFYLTIGNTLPCGESCLYIDPFHENNIIP